MLPRSVLLVDDDAIFRERLARALRARGYEVITAGDYDAALAAARAESPASSASSPASATAPATRST